MSAEEDEESPRGAAVDDSRLADALVAHQDRLLSAIQDIESRSVSARRPDAGDAPPSPEHDGEDAEALLRHKIERLERSARIVERELESFKRAFASFSEFLDEQISSNNRNLLENVYQQFRQRKWQPRRATAAKRASSARDRAKAHGASIAAWVLGLAAFLALSLLLLRRFYAGQRYKGVKTHRH